MAKSSDLERVAIYWYAVPNADKSRGGWMPVYDHIGKQRGSTYGKGYDLETALAMAKADAEDEASRYIGDWDVVVAQKPGSPGAVKTKQAKKAPSAGPARKERDDLPWQSSYANWTIRVGEAAARHGSSIAFGSETHDAWKAGVSPDAYAKARVRR